MAASVPLTFARLSRKSSLSTGAAWPGGGRWDLRCREFGRELPVPLEVRTDEAELRPKACWSWLALNCTENALFKGNLDVT